MKVKVHITPRSGVLDPEGKAIEQALHNLGFANVRNVRHGKSIELDIDESDRTRANEAITRMCEQLLANTVIEDYSFEIDG